MYIDGFGQVVRIPDDLSWGNLKERQSNTSHASYVDVLGSNPASGIPMNWIFMVYTWYIPGISQLRVYSRYIPGIYLSYET